MLFVLGGLALIFAAFVLFYPISGRGHYPSRTSLCQSNLKQISLGFKQYVQDFDEKFPPASTGNGQGWADALQPYLKSRQLFECPAGSERLKENRTDYFYNRRVARREEQTFEWISNTILAGDGLENAPSNVSIAGLPKNWPPSLRHTRSEVGANYAFADGHVKWLQPEKVMAPKISASEFSFAVS